MTAGDIANGRRALSEILADVALRKQIKITVENKTNAS